MLYDPVARELTVGNEELIDTWEQNPELLLWADFVDSPEEQERSVFLERFGLHPLAVQDAQRNRHPPKIEAFGDKLFLLFKALRGAEDDFEFGTIQLAVFLGPRFLLTRRVADSPSTDSLWNELLADYSRFGSGLDTVVIRLCRIMVGRYLQKVLMLENRLGSIEEEMIDHPNDELLAELIGYKTSLNKYRRVFLYHVQIFDELRTKALPNIKTECIHEINDVYEQQERVSSLAGLYYEIASDLIDGHISLASHRLNNIVRVLTIITAVFVPLSFLAGIYGMNFEYMPELTSRAGYFVLLGVMASIVSVLLYIFRKKSWL